MLDHLLMQTRDLSVHYEVGRNQIGLGYLTIYQE